MTTGSKKTLTDTVPISRLWLIVLAAFLSLVTAGFAFSCREMWTNYGARLQAETDRSSIKRDLLAIRDTTDTIQKTLVDSFEHHRNSDFLKDDWIAERQIIDMRFNQSDQAVARLQVTLDQLNTTLQQVARIQQQVVSTLNNRVGNTEVAAPLPE